MIEKKIELWPEGKMPSADSNQFAEPYVEIIVPDERTTDACLIIAPGGAYMGWAWDVEGVPLREYFLPKGLTIAILRYRTPRPQGIEKHITAWQDAQRAIRIVRANARELGYNPDNIGFIGFSAAGHLALMAATSSETKAYEPIDDLDDLPCNVNFAIPIYPAYILSDGVNDANTNRGNGPEITLVPELKFDASTPPMCLLHGDADGISAMGSVHIYHKLRTMDIPVELHIMAKKGHVFFRGAEPGEPAYLWRDRIYEWMKFMRIW